MGARFLTIVAAAALCFAAPGAMSATVTATVTADNHYALYYGDAAGLVYVGRNEKGTAGNPGAYNWSMPETFDGLALGESDRLYVVHWDELPNNEGTTQAILGQFVASDGRYLFTGLAGWSYFLTSAPNPGTDGDPPDAASLETLLASATWSAPGWSLLNGANGPWTANNGGNPA